jgi:hypothetical protein
VTPNTSGTLPWYDIVWPAFPLRANHHRATSIVLRPDKTPPPWCRVPVQGLLSGPRAIEYRVSSIDTLPPPLSLTETAASSPPSQSRTFCVKAKRLREGVLPVGSPAASDIGPIHHIKRLRQLQWILLRPIERASSPPRSPRPASAQHFTFACPEYKQFSYPSRSAACDYRLISPRADPSTAK